MPVLALLTLVLLGYADGTRPFGIDRRPEARPYLGLPAEEGHPPPLLSQTGAFADVGTLTPSAALITYDLIVPFWSDGAEKRRWIAVPNDGAARIREAADGEWSFPAGTVFVKHFEIATDEARPEARRRLETRLLVRDAKGGVYGRSYRWRADGSDAELVRSAQVESLTIRTPGGGRRQNWFYPGPADCRQCHTPAAGGVLGVKPRQLDRAFTYPSGVTDNQLRTWGHLSLIDADTPRTPRLAGLDDHRRTIEDRARSYLDANCSHCHRPGGAAADFDARYGTPLREQRLIGVPARINFGIDGARQIAPNDPWRSMVLARLTTLEPTRMPPLSHEVVDRRGVELIREWIASLPGPPVLAPPAIRPRGIDSREPVRVVIEHPDPSATIRFTLDGSAPGKSSPVYAGPFEVGDSATVRARAYRSGWARSIAVQETFIIGDL